VRAAPAEWLAAPTEQVEELAMRAELLVATVAPEAPAVAPALGPAEAPKDKLSASAADFSPGMAAATAPLTEEVDVVNLLPPSHRALLRGGYYDYTGAYVMYYIGRLKSFNVKNGYGFIECMRSRRDYGADVFVHKNFVPMPWNIGQPVEFAVMANQRGQPQAFDVNWLPRLDRPQPRGTGGAGGPGSGTSTGGTGDTSGSASRASGSAQVAAAAAPRKLGTLKSFSQGQGYGFISNEEVFQMHQRDTYFDKGQIPQGSNWHFGQTIEFSVFLNPRGQPQARDINWDPVPYSLPETPGLRRPDLGQQSVERLQKLLTLLHEKNAEKAIITAIDLQGGAGADVSEKDKDTIDYVTFVLDRLGAPEETTGIGDVAKMLLLLMLSKMLRKKSTEARCSQIVSWFEHLATTITPTNAPQVVENLQSVHSQVSTHLRQALQDNEWVAHEEQATRIHAAFVALQTKVKELPPQFTV